MPNDNKISLPEAASGGGQSLKDRDNASLIDLALQLYARSSYYPNSKEMHDGWVAAVNELKQRLASLDRLRKENAELRNERNEARQGWAERNHQIMNMARALNCTVDVVSEKVALLTAERDTAQARALMLQGEREEAQNRCADANVELAWAKESIASLQTSLAAAEARAEKLKTALISATTDEKEDPCYYDHRGYCQSHWLQPKGECYMELARAALKEEEQSK